MIGGFVPEFDAADESNREMWYVVKLSGKMQ